MKRIFAIGALLLSSVAMFAQPQLTKDNIDEVVAAMTLEEKATLLVGSGWGSMTAGSMTASATALVPGAAGTTRSIERLGNDIIRQDQLKLLLLTLDTIVYVRTVENRRRCPSNIL